MILRALGWPSITTAEYAAANRLRGAFPSVLGERETYHFLLRELRRFSEDVFIHHRHWISPVAYYLLLHEAKLEASGEQDHHVGFPAALLLPLLPPWPPATADYPEELKSPSLAPSSSSSLAGVVLARAR